jgi:hypothetical protein
MEQQAINEYDFGQGISSPDLVTFTVAVAGGSVPPGLTLTTSGLLSGTPTQVRNYTFNIAETITFTVTGFLEPPLVLPPYLLDPVPERYH